MNTSIQTLEINASVEQVWDVLFNQYGDIHTHNPTMQSSNYMDNSAKGEINVVRHCQFNDKLFLDEKITDFKENESVTIEVIKHNLPMLKHLSATYELKSLGNNKTELRMVSKNSASPGFIIHLMKGQLKKSVSQHLFGMKYFIETSKTVDMKNYKEVYKNYK
ncbi:MAG: SRPBCC family protein [Cytophagales bacterium]|nr:SRPBCC family protein [Cytophagales bacterium]